MTRERQTFLHVLNKDADHMDQSEHFVQSDQHLCYKFVWFDSLGSSQQFLFMSEQVFMGWTSAKQLIKCLVHRHNRVTLPAVRLIPVALQPHSKLLPTEPLHRSYWLFGKYCSSTSSMQNFNILASLRSWAGWFESYTVANLKGKFSRDKTHIKYAWIKYLERIEL